MNSKFNTKNNSNVNEKLRKDQGRHHVKSSDKFVSKLFNHNKINV